MRFFSAVLVGGVAVGALMPGMLAFELLSGAGTLRTVMLVLVAFLISGVVIRRGWLAAAAAYVAGIAMWVVIYLRPSPPWAPSDNWTPATWMSFVLGNVLLGAVLFAVIGGIGGWIARVFLRRPPPSSVN